MADVNQSIHARVAAVKQAWLRGGDKDPQKVRASPQRRRAGQGGSSTEAQPPVGQHKDKIYNYTWNNQAAIREDRKKRRTQRQAEGRMEMIQGMIQGGAASDHEEYMCGDASGEEVVDEVGPVVAEGFQEKPDMFLDGVNFAGFVLPGLSGIEDLVSPRVDNASLFSDSGEESVKEDLAIVSEDVQQAVDLVGVLQKKKKEMDAIESEFWTMKQKPLVGHRKRRGELAKVRASLLNEEYVEMEKTAQALAVLRGTLDMRELTNNCVGDAFPPSDKGGSTAKILQKEVEHLRSLLGDSYAHLEQKTKQIGAGPDVPEKATHSSVRRNSSPLGSPITRDASGYLSHASLRGGFLKDRSNKDPTVLSAKRQSLAVRVTMMRVDYGALHEIVDMLTHSPKVTTFAIEHNWIQPIGASILAPALDVSSQLQVLDLSSNDIRVQGAIAIAPAISGMYKLKVLNLGVNHICDDGLRAISSSLTNLTRLEVLDLSVNKITTAGVDALFPFLSDAKYLRSFVFAGNVTRFSFQSSEGPEIMYKLSPYLQKLPSFESLNVASNYLFGLGTKYACQVVTESSGQIKHLHIGGSRFIGNKIGPSGAKSLAAALFHTPLISLDTSFNELGAEGTSIVSNALTFQTCLMTLSLRGNKMGHAGMRSLANALKATCCITSLNLADNHLGSDSLETLCTCVEKHTSLSELNLSGNALTALEQTVGANNNYNGFARFCTLMRNGSLPSLQYMDLRDTGIDKTCNRLLVSALGQHTKLTRLNELKAPQPKTPKWAVPHPLELAELLFISQRVQALPKASASAIMSGWKHYVSVDLSHCGLLSFPTSILELGTVEELNLSNNPLATLPYERLVHTSSVQSIDLRECRNLLNPPQAATHRGGISTMQYMRDSQEVIKTITMPMMLCGDHDAKSKLSSIAAILPLAELYPVMVAQSKRNTTASSSTSKYASKRSSISQAQFQIHQFSKEFERRNQNQADEFPTAQFSSLAPTSTSDGSSFFDRTGKLLSTEIVHPLLQPVEDSIRYDKSDAFGKSFFGKTDQESLFQGMHGGDRSYDAWKMQKLASLGSNSRVPKVWSPSDMGKYYFKPLDISGATLSTECLELFMVKKAVYVVVWDADSSNHAGNIVHWLDAIGTHVPCACVVFVGVKRSTTQEEVVAAGQSTVKEAVCEWVARNNHRIVNLIDMKFDGMVGESIVIDLDDSAPGLTLLGHSLLRLADRLFTEGEYVHPDTDEMLEGLQLDYMEKETWREWRSYLMLGELVFNGDTGKVHVATDALHDLGHLRCVKDLDSHGDNPGSMRPLLDVVFVDLPATIELARNVPKEAAKWKLWELVHFLRSVEDSPRNPRRAKTKTKTVKHMNLVAGIFRNSKLKGLTASLSGKSSPPTESSTTTPKSVEAREDKKFEATPSSDSTLSMPSPTDRQSSQPKDAGINSSGSLPQILNETAVTKNVIEGLQPTQSSGKQQTSGRSDSVSQLASVMESPPLTLPKPESQPSPITSI